MKTATGFHKVSGLLLGFFLLFVSISAPCRSWAEDADKFSREELAQMLAPIALYPDTLLSQVLMASTYPLEIVEADRWVKKNPGLKDEDLDDALLDQDWDPSVKAVCHFPTVLSTMSDKLEETTNIGNAFLGQESEVMDMVQELRAKAHERDHLTSNTEQRVIVEKDTIIIEPTDPRVVYVPYYDPYRVYGPWWYPDYPPYYWVPSGVNVGIGVSFWPGIYFGFSFGDWVYFDWYRRYIHIDIHHRPRFVRHDRWVTSGRWEHVPVHRRGIAYHDRVTAERFGRPSFRPVEVHRASRNTQRMEIHQSFEQQGQNDFNRQIGEQTERQSSRKSRNDRNRTQQPLKVDSVQPTVPAVESDQPTRRQFDRKTQRDERRRTLQLENTQPESFQSQATPGVELQQPEEPVRTNRMERQRVDQSEAASGEHENRRRQQVDTESPRRNARQAEPTPEQPVNLEQQLMNQATPSGDAVEQTQEVQRRDNGVGRFESGQSMRPSSERGRSNRQRIPENQDEDEKSHRGRGRR